MDKKYRVIFLGVRENAAHFRADMSRLGAAAAVIDRMVFRAPVILKGDMTLGDARRYAEAVQQAGGMVNIQECGLFEQPKRVGGQVYIQPLGKFTMCPECGFKQLKTEICKRCGFQLLEAAEGNRGHGRRY